MPDGVQRIADYDGVSGLLQNRYVYGTGMDEPLVQVAAGGTVTFFHHDRLGSIIARTNSGGAVLDQYKYGPFGFTPALPNTSFGYTGQRYDEETGLYYYKARYYSPILGRFLQPDPIGYADSLNLYEYVGNDPMNFTDPLGLSPLHKGRVEENHFADGAVLKGYISNDLPGGPPDPSLQQIRGNVPHEDDCKKKKDERLKDTGSGPVIDDVSIGSAAGGGGGGTYVDPTYPVTITREDPPGPVVQPKHISETVLQISFDLGLSAGVGKIASSVLGKVAGAAAGWIGRKVVGTIDPSRVRFSQDQVSGHVRTINGARLRLHDAVNLVRSGQAEGLFKPIRIFEATDGLRTLDNRRLLIYSEAGKEPLFVFSLSSYIL